MILLTSYQDGVLFHTSIIVIWLHDFLLFMYFTFIVYYFITVILLTSYHVSHFYYSNMTSCFLLNIYEFDIYCVLFYCLQEKAVDQQGSETSINHVHSGK